MPIGTNSPSVIWVAGEVKGYSDSGAQVTVSGIINEASASESFVGSSVSVASAATAALKAKIVASGILPNF